MPAIALKLLGLGKRLISAIGRGAAWLIEKPVRLLVAVLLLALAWQLLIVGPDLRGERDTARAAAASEAKAHRETKNSYRLAQIEARKLEAARIARVGAQQQEITDEVVETFESRLAAAHARAGDLAQQLREAGGTGKRVAGATGPVGVPGTGDSAGAAAQATGDRGLPSPVAAGWGRSPEEQLERDLVATEQALQLDALIDWVERQAAIDVNETGSGTR